MTELQALCNLAPMKSKLAKLREKECSESRREFLKVKRFVEKRFPGAHTMAKETGGKTHYSVVSASGYSVMDPELNIPPAKTVRQAWDNAKYAIWFGNMIRKSNAAFSEEAILKRLAKESGE